VCDQAFAISQPSVNQSFTTASNKPVLLTAKVPKILKNCYSILNLEIQLIKLYILLLTAHKNWA